MRAGISTSTLLAALISASALVVMAPIQADDNTVAAGSEIAPTSPPCAIQRDNGRVHLARVSEMACAGPQGPAMERRRRPAS